MRTVNWNIEPDASQRPMYLSPLLRNATFVGSEKKREFAAFEDAFDKHWCGRLRMMGGNAASMLTVQILRQPFIALYPKVGLASLETLAFSVDWPMCGPR